VSRTRFGIIGQFKLPSEEKNHILISFEDVYLTLVLIDWLEIVLSENYSSGRCCYSIFVVKSIFL